MRPLNEIIIHCTDTPSTTTVESIRRYHKSLGWSDIGYHYLVDHNGNWHKGRDLALVGAHCKGHNTGSIGIAYIGKYANGTDIENLARVCNFLIGIYPSIKKVSRHCHYDKGKTCPNFSEDNIKQFNAICKVAIL